MAYHMRIPPRIGRGEMFFQWVSDAPLENILDEPARESFLRFIWCLVGESAEVCKVTGLAADVLRYVDQVNERSLAVGTAAK